MLRIKRAPVRLIPAWQDMRRGLGLIFLKYKNILNNAIIFKIKNKNLTPGLLT